MPDPRLVVGVDVGTTGVKAAAVDDAAVSHGGAEREYPTESPFPGWSVQDPDRVAAATAAVVRDVTARAGAAGRPVAGVAFSGAMHSLIALAPDGSPLTPSVTWADSRAAAQAQRPRDSGERLALHRRTGTPVHPMSPLVKLLWFRERQPEVGFPASEQGSAAGAALLGHVALGHLRSVDDAAALVRLTEVVHPDRDAARFYRRLLPAFARTAEAVEDLDAWRSDGSADAAAAVLAGQASKEEMP